MNTRFSYLYRDGANFKQFGSVILEGLYDEGLESRLKASLGDLDYFTPWQVDVPPKYLYPEKFGINDQDHCFHEFYKLEAAWSDPTDERTIEEFVADFEAAADEGWETKTPEEVVTYYEEETKSRSSKEGLMKKEICIKVEYNLNGADGGELVKGVVRHLERAIGEGVLTGLSPAEVERWEIKVKDTE